jgi:hypothetical protein
MADPFTLTAVGVVALTEGVKFLYGQAGEALKRWRGKAITATTSEAATVEPVDVKLPSDVFAGQLERPQLDLKAVGELEQDLRDLRAAVADYAQGIDELDPSNERALQAIDALRQAMEAVYGQRITFKGEPRPDSGRHVVGEAKVDDVLGYVAGLRASRIISGTAIGRVEAKRVGPGGTAVGLEADTIG